jgi:zinc/manganese transport system substrate-binding protein
MSRTLIVTLSLLAVAVLGPREAHADLRVAATVPDLAALAKAVGGDKVQVTALSLPTQDPHFVDARPNLALVLNRADLLLAVGSDLEVGWLPGLQTGARNARIQAGAPGYLECADHVRLLEVPTGRIDRSQGDIHGGGNPHYLFDPRQAKACAGAIAARMADLDPGNAAVYRANLAAFTRELERRRADWERRMAPYRGHKIITYHKSWSYLAEWLGLEVVANLEPKPGIPPSPRHVAQVIQLARAGRVRVILQEGFYPSRTGALVAARIDGVLVELPGGTDVRAGQSYLDHMEAMIARLEAAFRRAT